MTIINPGGEFFYEQTTIPVITAQPTLTYENAASIDDDLLGDEYEDDNIGPTTTSTRPTAGSTGVPARSGRLQCYRLASDFPSQWVSLQTLIDTSRPDMVGSSNDGPDEADAVIAGVLSVADKAGLDPYDPPGTPFYTLADARCPQTDRLCNDDAGEFRESPTDHWGLRQVVRSVPGSDTWHTSV
ncbi:MAG: hypothetical protein Q9180_002099 [Flavoplaca navasiana]